MPVSHCISIVEFPTAAKNWLSSGLIVFSDGAIEGFENDDTKAFELIAHELAHLWFGVSLRAEGPAARWLSESFAEYYAWRAVAALRGDLAAKRFIDQSTAESSGHAVPLRSLGFEDELVYTRGALGVRALASAVGEPMLDRAIHRLSAEHLPWSVDSLIAELARQHMNPQVLHAYREEWGI